MILLTGATGTVGRAVLARLTAAEHQVRCLVRDPRKLGSERIRVQLALGDLAHAGTFRNALRGVHTVIHLAASIRDQPAGSLEEVNGLATARLIRAAELARCERFVFFSALGASAQSRTRFMRSKALAAMAVERSSIPTSVFWPSIIYAPGDPWLTLLARLSILPAVPIAGAGHARFQPIWADDVAACVLADLSRPGRQSHRNHVLAGPQEMTYNEIVAAATASSGRGRRLLHVPLPVVRTGLRGLERMAGQRAFATWEEAALMEEPMVAARACADVEALGVTPQRMAAVLDRRRRSSDSSAS